MTEPYRSKPMTLFVTKVLFTDGEHLGKEEERTIDVQISKEQARELINILQENIDKIPGSKSFRLKGKLVL